MITVHTICSLLSYGAFLVAFVTGVLFLIQERQVKQKRMGLLFHRLPALQTLDHVNVIAIGIGFTLLTLGLLCGLVGSRELLGVWWRWDSKELLTLLLWSSYLALWLVRLRSTLRGRKVAFLSILGFTFVLFTLFGARRLFPTWHSFL